MSSPTFQRARSADAKRAREDEILRAAQRLAGDRGVRSVTLTEVAGSIGMHKSALLRYFETREQILLLLAADEWRAWSAEIRQRLGAATSADDVPAVFAETLVGRPLFCDLLGHVPLSLERNVSLDSVRRYKLGSITEVRAIVGAVMRLLPGLPEEGGIDLVATATSLAGAFWQMATPSPMVGELYRTDPALSHAIVDVGPRLTRILGAYLRGIPVPGDPSGAADS